MLSVLQVGETEPFIAELLGELTTTIQDLETHQIHMFYEAVGLMISADADNKKRDHYLVTPPQPGFEHGRELDVVKLSDRFLG